MPFKHKTDTVHYHDTVADARECESPALCAHQMDARNCFGPQHYMYDADEQTFGGMVNEGPVFERDPADEIYGGMSDQKLWEMGYPVMTHFQGSLRTGDGMWYKAGHDDPCVCSPYDKCGPQRRADVLWSGNWRDQFRSYCD